MNPIPDRDNIIEKMMIVVRDVTDLRALEKEAEKQQQQMQKIAQILSIAHEKFLSFLKSSSILRSKPIHFRPACDCECREYSDFISKSTYH